MQRTGTTNIQIHTAIIEDVVIEEKTMAVKDDRGTCVSYYTVFRNIRDVKPFVQVDRPLISEGVMDNMNTREELFKFLGRKT